MELESKAQLARDYLYPHFRGNRLMVANLRRVIPGVSIVSETEAGNGNAPGSVLVSRFAGDRSRIGAAAATAAYQIERRDLARRFRIDPLRRRYQVIPILELLSEKEKDEVMRSGCAWRERVAPEPGPDAQELRIRFQYDKTGEEKSLFGCTARRWITTCLSTRDSVRGNIWDESIADEWYLDSEELERNYPGYSSRLVHRGFVTLKSSRERLVVDHSGERPRGFCVSSLTVQRHHAELPDGTVRDRSSSFANRVVTITREVFSESEFEPPAGFRQIPLYPGRWAIMRSDLTRSFRRLAWKLLPSLK